MTFQLAPKVIRVQRAGDFARKPEEWLREAEWRMERNAKRDEKKNKKEIDDAKPQSDKHFLLYWQERNVREHEASGYPLDVVSSRQLKRAKAGDTLWLATINQAGELILAGRLKIGEIVDYQTAIRKLNDTSLWDGGFFALPKENEAEFLRSINIKDVQLDLRFANSEADRFVLKNGKINAQQLQTMRKLSAESVDVLSQIWESMENEETGDDFKDDFDAFDEENYLGEFLENCRLIVSQQPDSAYAHYNLGVALDENDLPEEAKIAYLKAIELDPNYWTAYYNLGQYYLRARELNKAEQSFKDAVRLAPDFAPAWFMLGVVYGEMEDFQRAIAVTKEGLEYDPNDPKAYFNVGNFYFHLRDYEEAARWFEKSAEIEPNAPDTFYRLGKCYREIGEKEKEFDAYSEAVEVAPDFVDALFALGTAYAHLTETQEGEQVPYFETGGELILSDPRVSFYLGLAQLALGNVDDAGASVTDLPKMDASLADQLQFFIDRYEQKNEEAKVTGKTQPETKKAARQQRKPIEFYIDDESFKAKNIPEMYQKALEYLVDARLLNGILLPVATGEKRYILAAQPVHPTGKPFLAPVEYKGFFMEAHNNRSAAIAQLRKLIESAGCTFSQSSEFLPKKDAFNNLKPENKPAGNDADLIRESIKTERGTDFIRIEDIMETTNTKIELNLDADEAERLARKPRKEDLIPDHLRAKIKPLTAEEREEFGITALDEAWGKAGMMTIEALLTVHPDDYSEEQNFKAHRLELWDKSREEIKELLRIERRQNELGIKL